MTQYNGFVALGAAVVVIGFYNGTNAGQAIKDAHQAAQGRSFLAAVSAAGIQLFAFLINATKGSPAAGMIGVPGDQWLDLSVGRADIVEVPVDQLRQAQQNHLRLLTSPPVTLLALEIGDSGALSNPLLRSSLAMAIDRSALSNVIYQKQGEVTASLLPASVTGYSFLFPTERDLNKAQGLRGGLTPRQLTLSSESGPSMQLAAQRIALNLREAGFNVQVATGTQRGDLTLRTFSLESRDPQSALEAMLRHAGDTIPVTDASAAALFQVEREFLDRKTLIPLLYLPRAYAVSGRVRDLRLDAHGTPDLGDASLESAP